MIQACMYCTDTCHTEGIIKTIGQNAPHGQGPRGYFGIIIGPHKADFCIIRFDMMQIK